MSVVFETETDSFGKATIPDGLLHDYGILWVSRPGFMAAWQRTGAGSEGLKEFVLSAADSVAVLVVDVDGNPVPEAPVSCRGLRAFRYPPQGGRGPAFAQQAMMEWTSTDASGVATFPAYPFSARYIAESNQGFGDMNGSGAESVTIVVEGYVLVRGQVVPNPGVGGGLITAYAGQDMTPDGYIGFLEVLSDGTIPEAYLPSRSTDVYSFQLEGPGMSLGLTTVTNPGEGQAIELRLTSDPGRQVHVAFVDPEGSPVSDVATSIQVIDDALGWPVAACATPSDHQGNVELRAPDGLIKVVYSHDRFLSDAYGPLDPATTPGDHLLISLEHKGAIEGRVHHQGEPVESFEVWYFEPGSTVGLGWQRFDSTVEGRFHLDNVPIGEVELVVHGPGLPQSTPQVAIVQPGDVTGVDIEIPASLSGRGRVVDVATGDPIEGVGIWRGLSSSESVIGYHTRDAEVRTGPDGGFSLTGFALAEEHVYAALDGYQTMGATGSRTEGQAYDFRVIALKKETTMTMVFSSAGEVDWSEYKCWLRGQMNDGPFPIPEDGVQVLAQGRSGSIDIFVERDGGLTTRYPHANEGEGPYTVEVPPLGDTELVVELIGAEDELTSGAYLEFELQDGTRRVLWDRQPESIRIYEHMPPGSYAVNLRSAGDSFLARGAVTTNPTDSAYLALSPCDEQEAVRVVDPEGVPLGGIQVTVWELPSLTRLVEGATDSLGVFRLGCSGADHLLLELRQGEQGRCRRTGVLPGVEGSPTEVVFEAFGLVELLLLDGSLPVPDVQLEVSDGASGYSLMNWPTDSEGKLRLIGIPTGPYSITAQSSAFWPIDNMVSFSEGEPGPLLIQTRLRGDLVVDVVDSLGMPSVGVAVELTSQEFGSDVGSWLTEGLIAIQGGEGLESGVDGRLVVSGLPHGEYAWSIGDRSGAASVPPGGVGQLEVTFAE